MLRRLIGSVAVVLGAVLTLAVTTAPAGAASVRPDGDSPGFYYGIDSSGPTVGGGAPYNVPYVQPAYPARLGGYVGEVGSWARWQGCPTTLFYNATDYAAANANYYRYHLGVGSSVYWMLGGPGVDPATPGRTPTVDQAYAWGAAQAKRTLDDIAVAHLSIPRKFIVMDVELPGVAPATDNGWNHIYPGKCGGSPVANYVSPTVDRAVFNGYYAYVLAHSSYAIVVYSGPGSGAWDGIFGTGAQGMIPNTYEWTYLAETPSVSTGPQGWCAGGTCARFFGGQTSANAHAFMWQWSGGGGIRNGHGDYDQIDTARLPRR
ncbi:MAG: hypothetical protein ACR2JQ_09005 [Mycobacteriales bacterium]